MALAHPLLGIFGGLIAALLARFAAGWPLWQVVCTFLGVGTAVCVLSGGVSLFCAWRDETPDRKTCPDAFGPCRGPKLGPEGERILKET